MSKIIQPLAGVAVGAVVVGVLGLTATSAHADTVGPLSIDPAAGNLDTVPTVTTTSLCPGGDSLAVLITGTGFPSAGTNITGVGSQATYVKGAGYSVPLKSLRDIANLPSTPVTYSGSYTLTLRCRNNVGLTTFGDFTNTVVFADATTWAAGSNPSPSPTATSPSPTATSPSPTATSPSPTATSPSPTATSPSPTGTSPSPTATSPSPTSTGDAAKLDEILKVNVPTGSLVITSTTTAVTLPGLKLDDKFSQYLTSGEMGDVAVTDTRAGALGFTVTGQVTPFSNGSATIAASGLGWTPKVKSFAGLTVTAGASVAPGVGLATPKTLATAKGLGTAVLGADLSLIAPVTTPSGDYTATLTITAI